MNSELGHILERLDYHLLKLDDTKIRKIFLPNSIYELYLKECSFKERCTFKGILVERLDFELNVDYLILTKNNILLTSIVKFIYC